MAQVYAWVAFQLDQWALFDLEEYAVFVIHVELEITGDCIGPGGHQTGLLYPAPNIFINSGCISLTGQVLAKCFNKVFVGNVPELVVDVDFGPHEIAVDLAEYPVSADVFIGDLEIAVPLATVITVHMGDGVYVDFTEIPAAVFMAELLSDVGLLQDVEALVALDTVSMQTETGVVDLIEIEVWVQTGIPKISVDSEAGNHEYLTDVSTTQ